MTIVSLADKLYIVDQVLSVHVLHVLYTCTCILIPKWLVKKL